MRLIHQDPSTGLLKLRLETPSDLWRISRLVRPGDRVGASTTRRDPEAPEDAPAAQRERRRVWLVVRAEQVEFHGFSRHVRITGPILEGPFDIGRHHTLDLGEGDEMAVVKDRLTAADRALIEEGRARTSEPVILLAVVDWGESSVVRLHGRVIEPVADVNRTLSGKRFKGASGEKDRESYAAELAQLVAGQSDRVGSVLIAGPGFLKERIARLVTELDPSAKSKIKVVSTSESGRVGVDELLRSGRAAEALEGSQAAEESDLVEQLVRALGGGTRAAVGIGEVREAADGGALETLLVSDALLHDDSVLPVLEAARAGRARTFIVREDSEAGRRLKALGRVGALLRFDWVPTGHPRPVR